MIDSRYPEPTSQAELRALLKIIDVSIERSDGSTLYFMYDLSSVVDATLRDDFITYIDGLRERIREAGNDSHYYIYTDEDVAITKENLDRVAYGDFGEAMIALTSDLRGTHSRSPNREVYSDVFQSHFFSTEDRGIWNRLRIVMQDNFERTGDKRQDAILEDAVAELRSYLQKTYGSLIPVMIGTYLKKTPHKTEGVSVRLAWLDQGLHVVTHAPFSKELDDFFIDESPVESVAGFTPKCFPKQMGDYQLGGITSMNLFHYEL